MPKQLQTDYQYLEEDDHHRRSADVRNPSSPSSYFSAGDDELRNNKQQQQQQNTASGSSNNFFGDADGFSTAGGSTTTGRGSTATGRTRGSNATSTSKSFRSSDEFKRIFDRKKKSKSSSSRGSVSSFKKAFSQISKPKNNSLSNNNNNNDSNVSGSNYHSHCDDDDDDETETTYPIDEEEVYLVKQRYGYFSVIFSIAQVAILIIMMAQCGIAPLNINPMIGPYPDALSEWGGKNAVNILDDGEWWRLITPIMLHAGIIHLLCNVAVQIETGAFFEREWGSRNWLIIYMVSAVGSSILSVIFMPDAVSVGSSGAVMGLFGGKLAEVICRACESSKTQQGRIGHQVRKEQCAGATCSVIIVMLFSFIPYVDWAAHLGGVLAGFCIGTVVFACETPAIMWKIIWIAIGVSITIIYFVVTLHKMYSGDIEPAQELRDVCGYYKQYFDDYECNCMRDEQSGDN